MTNPPANSELPSPPPDEVSEEMPLIVLTLTPHDGLGESLSELLTQHGFQHLWLRHPDELWENGVEHKACLLCSHPLPDGLTGVNILDGIQQRSWLLPTMLLSEQWKVQEVVQAMKAGASSCITLPYDPEHLVAELKKCLEDGQMLREQARLVEEMKARVATLDKRELQVVKHVLAGKLNKEIAHKLNLALVTIKLYRARAMRKLGAGNPAELGRIAHIAGLCDDLGFSA